MDRVGEVWEQSWYHDVDVFLVLGCIVVQGERYYTLLNLELGTKDRVRAYAFNDPKPAVVKWRRIA